MWPWEHVAFGYLGYSIYRHVRYASGPRDGPAIVVVLAALAPDLIDKPLSWSLGLFPSGYAVGHSVFTFTAIVAATFAIRRRWHGRVDAAVAIGHGSHLVGDVVYPALLGEGLAFGRVLWPLVTLPAYETRLGLVSRTLAYLHRFGVRALSGEIATALAIQIGLVAFVFGLWLYDGAPGLGRLLRSAGSTERG